MISRTLLVCMCSPRGGYYIEQKDNLDARVFNKPLIISLTVDIPELESVLALTQ